jgi:hypothetical protein
MVNTAFLAKNRAISHHSILPTLHHSILPIFRHSVYPDYDYEDEQDDENKRIFV